MKTFEYGQIVEVWAEGHPLDDWIGTVIHQKGSRVSVSFSDDHVATLHYSDLKEA